MPPLFDLRNLSLHLGGKSIFDDLSFSFTEQYKIALIGRNGTGKSTLCRVIIGDENLDSGEVYKHHALRLGFLRQDDDFLANETVSDYLQRVSDKPAWQCAELAYKFALTAEMVAAPIMALSGGWRMRVKLTALLLHEPNFLLLDEPTNFLDLRTQLLLQKFLLTFRGGALVISHDREFLQATCEHTLALSRGKLNYAPLRVREYLQKQAEQSEHHERANVAKLSKIRQLQTFIDKNRAGANTASQARSKQKQLDRIELNEIIGAENCAQICLPPVTPPRKTLLQCDDLAIGYGEKIIAEKINFSLEPSERLLITGDNGQGKTTLLKTLTSAINALSGKIYWGYNLTIGVYAQHVYQSLPASLTVREYLMNCNRVAFGDQQVLNTAGGFLFSGADIDKSISVLSGGERARLCLAGLFLANNNVLILDEPSNHLDVETAQSLAQALRAYQGGVIFVSHERTFAQTVSTGVLEIANGKIRRVLGNFNDYLQELTNENNLRDERAKNLIGEINITPTNKNITGRERRENEKRLTTLERKIAKLEAQINELIIAIENASNDWEKASKLNQMLATTRTEKMRTEDEWLSISTTLTA